MEELVPRARILQPVRTTNHFPAVIPAPGVPETANHTMARKFRDDRRTTCDG